MATEVAAKRLKPSPPLIGTHNGHFHADEALAVYLLRLLPTYSSSPLVRTRDPSILSTCHTVVDVGGQYSASANRYDHHQREFATTFPGHETKLSSAGLVYMHFGKAIISERTGLPLDSPELTLLYEKLYDDFVEALDANDNGISPYDTNALAKAGISKKFKDGGITLGSLVSDLNYAPAAPVVEAAVATKAQSQAEEDARFLSASTLMGETFIRKLNHCHRSWLPARSIIQKAFQTRHEVHPSGRILHIGAGLPWKEHLYSLEEADPSVTDENNVLYVLYPEKDNDPDSRWRIQCVSKEAGGFENRKSLPEQWRGVRDQDLDKIIGGLEGAVFVHASGFIGGHLKEEGVKEMAVKALGMD